MARRRIIVFDTTLRDGEQSPGASMTPAEKLRMAHQLEDLGVDVIEAGFPVSSPGDFLAVRQVAREIKGARVTALARATPADIDCAWEALRDAASPRINMIASTSDIHLKYQLKKTRSQVVRDAGRAVAYARRYFQDVEFSAVDATRTGKRFLCAVFEAAIAAGAGTVTIADTVGYALPADFGELVGHVRTKVRNIEDVTVSVHCHNDLGLATANTLSGIIGGAAQIKCTINGIGERAGNACLQEVVTALVAREDYFKCCTGIRTEHLSDTSKLLSEIIGHNAASARPGNVAAQACLV